MSELFTLFISDLHLSAECPQTTQIFLNFINHFAIKAQALYILGDLFEAWLGDDDINDFTLEIIDAIKKVSHSGLPIYFIRGNRDFLLDQRFAKACGMRLLNDPTAIDLYGQKTILMHGDTLCTLDTSYQNWRRIFTQPLTKKLILSLPLSWRRKSSYWLRNKSKQHQRNITAKITDVTDEAVTEILEKFQAKLLIHGHTHKPGIHHVSLNNRMAKRIVLGAWHHCGNALIISETGEPQLQNIA